MSRDENRKRMPTVAKVYDQFKEAFGTVKVIYAKEGNYEIGEKHERNRSNS